MQARATPASPSDGRLDSVLLRRGCLLFTSCWALTGAALGAWVLRFWWTQPVPVFNPQTDGPIPAYSGFDVLAQAFLMSVALGALGLLATVLGFDYLHSGPLARRWRIAWRRAVLGAAGVGVAFIGAFVTTPTPLFGPEVLGHPSWVLLVFSAAFMIVGAMMAAIIMAAARELGRQAAGD